MRSNAICAIVDCPNYAFTRGWCSKHYSRFNRWGDPHRRRESALEVFLRLSALETNECVLWPFSPATKGYGIVRVGKLSARVHRLALEIRTSAQPPDVMACHKPCIGCQPACLNYRHLYWGSAKDNARDSTLDGTQTHAGNGGTGGPRTIPWETIVTIRRELAEKTATGKQLAERYGITMSYVSAIKHRQVRKVN